MLCQMLGAVDAAVLTTRTAKAEHEVGEATLDIAAHMGIGQFIDRVEEGQYLTVVLQETDNGFLKAGQLLVRLITTRVMGGTAVEDVAATIAALVLRDALGEREAEDANHQRTLCVILGERCRPVLRMGLIGVDVGSLETVSTWCRSLYLLELRQLGQTVEQADEVRIWEVALVQQLTHILNGRRDALNEVGLALEIATEAVGSQHLQQTEQYEE